ncbi:YigZ family protein [Pelagicoccus mobilis]|uniref:YigZ family protein n=1 Tax=Pelagicoccus mobilis TaxID=415221 RepID=A0A934VU59_9BACT|nr:YigZ family protein [Pelagicoccus mobilis]MBK1880219.1 YigZ family protein [Pelagicoccus mobilis]
MSDAYLIPSENTEAEIVIQKSRFIAQAFLLESRDDVNGILEGIGTDHPNARHNCYAFIAGAPNDTQAYGFSDDGEPNGTAGKPMLKVLMHSGIGCILVVVTRYFGGIKLGTGGLVRAYTDATNEVLAGLKTSLLEEKTEAKLNVSYSMEPLIRNHLDKLSIDFSVDYSDTVALTLSLTAEQREQLAIQLVEHNLTLL